MTIQVSDNTALKFSAMDQANKQGSELYDKAASAFAQSSYSGNDRAFQVAFFNLLLEQIKVILLLKETLGEIIDLNTDHCNCSKPAKTFPKLK